MLRDKRSFYPSRILVVKSCRIRLFLRVLGRIQELFPGASTSCMLLHKMRNELDYDRRVKRVFVLPPRADTYSRRALPGSVRRELKMEDYDLAVVIYANEDGDGYANVREFAYALPVKQRVFINGSLALGFLTEPESHAQRAVERVKGLGEWCRDLVVGASVLPRLQWSIRRRAGQRA